MKYRPVSLYRVCGALVLAIGLIAGNALEARGQSPAAFYKGKTIEWIVSSEAGSSTDLLSRIAANHLGEALGAKVKVENMGRNKGLNFAFTRSKGDGLTLVSKAAVPYIMNDLANAPGVRYKCTEFNALANMMASSVFLFARKDFPYTTIEALRQAKGVKAGGTSARGNMVVASAFLFEVIGIDGKVIPGYKNPPAILLALGQGEVDLLAIQASTGLKKVEEGSIIPLFALGDERSPQLPDVPTLEELGVRITDEWTSVYNLISMSGQAVMTTPGVPAERVRFLRETFKNLSKNKTLETEMEKVAGYWTPFETGEKMQVKIEKVLSNEKLADQVETLVNKYSVAAR